MLAPELAEELRYIEISASRRIRSLRFGQSRSPVRGSGYEFETHRKYEVGEDLRRGDWNVSARMQELYLKRQFEEKEITVFLAASDNCTFGFLAFSDRVEAFELPRKGRGHVWRAIEQLYDLQPERRGTNWELALRFLRSHLRRMSIVFLLSDFITDPESPALADLPDLKILAQKHDVVPVIFGDRIERDLPMGRGLLRFRSAESGKEIGKAHL